MRLSKLALQIKEANSKHASFRAQLLPSLLAGATKSDLTQQDAEGNTILHLLAHDSGLNWVNPVLKTQDTLSIPNYEGETPIHKALSVGNLSELPTEFISEANFRLKNKLNQTPLQKAASCKYLDCVPLHCISQEGLLERDMHGSNVFDIASSVGDISQIPARFINLAVLTDARNRKLCPMENLLYFGTIKDLPIFKPYGMSALNKEERAAWVQAIITSNEKVDTDCKQDPDLSRVPFDQALLEALQKEDHLEPQGTWNSL